jgi:predicted nucleotidyltransferase
MAENRAFDRATLDMALRELGRRAYAAGKIVEIAIYGGCAVVLTLDSRSATKDVDAVFEKDKDFVRKIAVQIAQDFGWDKDWLNDGVKGWLSAAEIDPAAKVFLGTYPSEDQPGLRVFVARPEYLFAMKCRAMRIGGIAGSTDVDDIRRLAKAIGIKSAVEALDLVQAFYPRQVIEPKTQFGLEEIFSKLDEGGDENAPKKQ